MKKLSLTELTWNRHGITADDIAKALGISVTSVRRVGKGQPLTVKRAIQISEYIESRTGQKLMPWEYSDEYKGLRDLINKG